MQRLQSERDLFADNERRARTQYETVLHERKGQNVLLTNLQSIQNNLERSEFETKTRLGAQIEALEREVALAKEKLSSEEDKRSKVTEAYESQVADLESRLAATKTAQDAAESSLGGATKRIHALSEELASVQTLLEESTAELEASKDRVVRLEQDAGSEFRTKLRLLERKLADSASQREGLEAQVASAKKHAEQFEAMSLANEEALQGLTHTSEQFR